MDRCVVRLLIFFEFCCVVGCAAIPEIDPSEIEFDIKIGEGSYGQVFSGTCRGKTVAIKGKWKNVMILLRVVLWSGGISYYLGSFQTRYVPDRGRKERH